MARGIGGGLAAVGNQQLSDAQGLLGRAADQEQQRLLGNKQMEQAHKAGMTQLGTTLGATAGFSVGGPVGALIGGALGAIGAELF
jgi:hypothetical protein